VRNIILLAAMLALAPAHAVAQGFVSPFVGFDFGGDSGCPTASGCEDKNSNIGIAAGKLGSVFGIEAELGYARNFFGDDPAVTSNVLTFMSNVIIGPKIGPVRPFVLGGMGLLKTRVEFTTSGLLDTNNNNFGWDIGGGLMVLFGNHIGVRGDLRKFTSFQEHNILGFSLSHEKLGFQRASAGLVLAF
jgi:opacity protein-like surface antigen